MQQPLNESYRGKSCRISRYPTHQYNRNFRLIGGISFMSTNLEKIPTPLLGPFLHYGNGVGGSGNKKIRVFLTPLCYRMYCDQIFYFVTDFLLYLDLTIWISSPHCHLNCGKIVNFISVDYSQITYSKKKMFFVFQPRFFF